MEVSNLNLNLVRSTSLHSLSGSFQFRRSTSLGKLASPRPVKVHLGLRDSISMELRRARSETDLFQSGSARMPLLPLPLEEDEKDAMTTELKRQALTVQGMVTKEEPLELELEEEEFEARESFGSGMGNGGNSNFTNGSKGGQGSGDQSENRRFHDRYQELLRSDPGNPLLLRNYGKFLQEVEGNVKGAEECYGRAILVNPWPGDGELLMLYGMLVWENYREKERAGAYLHKATEVSPHDCMVLAAYAKFLWEVGDENDEDTNTDESMTSTPFQPLVAAS
ncbi:uncharacterized protein LOC144551778 [Carex rostrata]